MEPCWRERLVVVGLLFDLAGAIIVTRAAHITPEQAAEVGASRFGSDDPAENALMPMAQNLLQQSRAATWGMAFVSFGFLLQLLAVWPRTREGDGREPAGGGDSPLPVSVNDESWLRGDLLMLLETTHANRRGQEQAVWVIFSVFAAANVALAVQDQPWSPGAGVLSSAVWALALERALWRFGKSEQTVSTLERALGLPPDRRHTSVESKLPPVRWLMKGTAWVVGIVWLIAWWTSTVEGRAGDAATAAAAALGRSELWSLPIVVKDAVLILASIGLGTFLAWAFGDQLADTWAERRRVNAWRDLGNDARTLIRVELMRLAINPAWLGAPLPRGGARASPFVAWQQQLTRILEKVNPRGRLVADSLEPADKALLGGLAQFAPRLPGTLNHMRDLRLMAGDACPADLQRDLARAYVHLDQMHKYMKPLDTLQGEDLEVYGAQAAQLASKAVTALSDLWMTLDREGRKVA